MSLTKYLPVFAKNIHTCKFLKTHCRNLDTVVVYMERRKCGHCFENDNIKTNMVYDFYDL